MGSKNSLCNNRKALTGVQRRGGLLQPALIEAMLESRLNDDGSTRPLRIHVFKVLGSV